MSRSSLSCGIRSRTEFSRVVTVKRAGWPPKKDSLPNVSLDVTLDADKAASVIDLPEQFRNSNVLIAIVGAG